MQKRSIFLTIALIALTLVFASQAAQAVSMKAKLSKVKGKVQVKSSDTAAWQKASDGMTVTQGAKIKTAAKSEVTVAWGKDHAVKIDAMSAVSLTKMLKGKSGKQDNKVTLEKGKAFAKVGKMEKGSSFTVKTPTAVAGVRGSGFEFSDNSFMVVEGTVTVSAAGMTVDLTPGMMTEIPDFGMPPQAPFDVPPGIMKNLQVTFQFTVTVTVELSGDLEDLEEEYDEELENLDEEDLEDLEEEFGDEEGEDWLLGEDEDWDLGEWDDEDFEGWDEFADFEDFDDFDEDWDDEDLEDIYSDIDDYLEDDLLGDIIDSAYDEGFEPGCGGIMGTIEY